MSVVSGLLIGLFCLLAVSWLWTRKLAAGAEEAVPPAGQILPVRGGAIHYTDQGPRDGQTVVLIHGLAGNMHNCTYALADELSSDFRVIAIDRPGSGYSTRDHDDLATLPAQAGMIGDFLDKLGIDKPVLVGHSLGGALSLAMALDRKDRIGALALLAPLTAVIPAPPAVFKPLVVRSANELKVPGGILCGAGDRLVSRDLHGRSMQAYGLQYEELPGRGHMIPVTVPQACADFIRRMAAMAR